MNIIMVICGFFIFGAVTRTAALLIDRGQGNKCFLLPAAVAPLLAATFGGLVSHVLGHSWLWPSLICATGALIVPVLAALLWILFALTILRPLIAQEWEQPPLSASPNQLQSQRIQP